jgi:uncharacterized DUF497 family protein
MKTSALTRIAPSLVVAVEKSGVMQDPVAVALLALPLQNRAPNIDIIRIISARLADRSERHDYEEGQE